MKVNKPHASEYQYFKKNQIIWGSLTSASSKEIVEKMQEVGVTAISGETIIKNGKSRIISANECYSRLMLSNYGSLLLSRQHGGQGTLVTGVHENVDIPVYICDFRWRRSSNKCSKCCLGTKC
ncbi:hypothetical protein ACVXZ0_10705 [Staphylococcus aureus]